MSNLVEALMVTLGSAFVLYLKTHGAHWNVQGPDFPSLHSLFERQYEDIHDSIDDIAEKLRMLDVHVPASLEDLGRLSQIKDFTGPLPAAEMVATLMRDNETMLAVLENAINAAEEADQEGIIAYLGTRVEAHQKWRWFLRVTGKPS